MPVQKKSENLLNAPHIYTQLQCVIVAENLTACKGYESTIHRMMG